MVLVDAGGDDQARSDYSTWVNSYEAIALWKAAARIKRKYLKGATIHRQVTDREGSSEPGCDMVRFFTMKLLLPLEVRHETYDLLLRAPLLRFVSNGYKWALPTESEAPGEEIEPEKRAGAVQRFWELRPRPDDRDVSKTWSALAATCRWIRDEAYPFYYDHATVKFSRPLDFANNFLRYLTFIELFQLTRLGFSLARTDDQDQSAAYGTSGAHLIKQLDAVFRQYKELPNLDHLILEFRLAYKKLTRHGRGTYPPATQIVSELSDTPSDRSYERTDRRDTVGDRKWSTTPESTALWKVSARLLRKQLAGSVVLKSVFDKNRDAAPGDFDADLVFKMQFFVDSTLREYNDVRSREYDRVYQPKPSNYMFPEGYDPELDFEWMPEKQSLESCQKAKAGFDEWEETEQGGWVKVAEDDH